MWILYNFGVRFTAVFTFLQLNFALEGSLALYQRQLTHQQKSSNIIYAPGLENWSHQIHFTMRVKFIHECTTLYWYSNSVRLPSLCYTVVLCQTAKYIEEILWRSDIHRFSFVNTYRCFEIWTWWPLTKALSTCLGIKRYSYFSAKGANVTVHRIRHKIDIWLLLTAYSYTYMSLIEPRDLKLNMCDLESWRQLLQYFRRPILQNDAHMA